VPPKNTVRGRTWRRNCPLVGLREIFSIDEPIRCGVPGNAVEVTIVARKAEQDVDVEPGTSAGGTSAVWSEMGGRGSAEPPFPQIRPESAVIPCCKPSGGQRGHPFLLAQRRPWAT
jgi:hypothetical protein